MKLVEFDCPSCGAHLRIDGTRSTAFCEYCGRKLYIDDEIKRVKVTIDNAEEAGYAFEQGRMNAQTESAGELADRVQSLIGRLPEYTRLNKKRDQNNVRLIDLLAKESEAASKKIWGVYGLAIAFIALMIFYMISERDTEAVPYVLAAAGFIAVTALFRYAKRSLLRARIDHVKAELAKTSSQLQVYAQANGFEVIPEEYRTQECLKYIHSSLKASTAGSIPQALGNYERYRMQLNIAEQNRQQLEFQKQQLKEMEEMKRQMNEKDDGVGLGTAVAAGAAVFAGLSFLKDLGDD